jgi:membrane protein YqaA with SNARE-associated domain
MEAWTQHLLELMALPQYGLSTVFVVSFISATLLPLGSEPVVFGLVKLNPELFWQAVLVATAGNTLGGAVDWWMGYGAQKVTDKVTEKVTDHPPHSAHHGRAVRWLEKLGPKACLLAWLPLVGDPLCAMAGWLKFPFWPCLAYMAIGKFMRYFLMTGSLIWAFPGILGGPAGG